MKALKAATGADDAAVEAVTRKAMKALKASTSADDMEFGSATREAMNALKTGTDDVTSADAKKASGDSDDKRKEGDDQQVVKPLTSGESVRKVENSKDDVTSIDAAKASGTIDDKRKQVDDQQDVKPLTSADEADSAVATKKAESVEQKSMWSRKAETSTDDATSADAKKANGAS